MNHWNRRTFLKTTLQAMAAAGAVSGVRADRARAATDGSPAASLPSVAGNRFLTFNSIVRVNQIEAGRTQNLGADEAAAHTPAAAEALRGAIAQGWPGARMTWALSWLALQDRRPNYEALRAKLVEFHKRYGDEITFIPGGFFANMYNTRAQVNQDLHDALKMVSQMVGDGYRPRSVVAGFLAAENQRFLAEEEGIHVCQGNIWSQYAVDNGDGDGSICYPYYPSREHFCKPAQDAADFIDCVNLDGWTCDFLSARRPGHNAKYNSRLGVGPIEAFGQNRGSLDAGLAHMLDTTAQHFDRGFALNNFAWVTTCWELCLLDVFRRRSVPNVLDYLTRWLTEIRRRWPGAQCITQGAFGEAWRAQNADNAKINDHFVARGTGFNGSEPNLEIRWFMNRDFRLALLRDWQAGGPEQVIDLTRYDLPAAEPAGKGRNWSLMNCINQKQTRPQDKPVALAQLPAAEQALIRRHYPELFG